MSLPQTAFVQLDQQKSSAQTNGADEAAMAIQRGDAAAFARLFNDNRGKLLALAYRLTASTTDAEDVVQEAFVSSWRKHHQFQGQAKASTWLYRVTFNAALMHLRSRRRKGAASLDSLPAGQAEALIAEAPGAVAPMAVDVWMEQREQGDDVRTAVAELKPIDQAIVNLRFVDELSTEEVSERTGLSTAAVKTRLHRARGVMRDRIAVAHN
jgi:RNA polymerase sigma-70 factor, ECF subfamily